MSKDVKTNLDTREGFLQWSKAHKKEIVAAMTMATACVGAVLLYQKHRTNSADSMSQMIDKCVQVNTKTAEGLARSETASSIVRKEVLDHLTGEKLTATGLGNLVGLSNRQINQRIVDAGLAVRCPAGGYIFTDAGRQLGEEVVKTTKAGHTFSNIEWDKAVLQIICPGLITSEAA